MNDLIHLDYRPVMIDGVLLFDKLTLKHWIDFGLLEKLSYDYCRNLGSIVNITLLATISTMFGRKHYNWSLYSCNKH